MVRDHGAPIEVARYPEAAGFLKGELSASVGRLADSETVQHIREHLEVGQTQLFELNDPAAVCEAIREVMCSGRINVAVRAIDSIAGAVKDWSTKERLTLRTLRAWGLLMEGSLEEAAESAWAVAIELGRRDTSALAAFAVTCHGLACNYLARVDEAHRSLHAAHHIYSWALADESSALRVRSIIGTSQKRKGLWSHALETYRLVEAGAREIGHIGHLTTAMANRGVLYLTNPSIK
jgi:hypothetical protein